MTIEQYVSYHPQDKHIISDVFEKKIRVRLPIETPLRYIVGFSPDMGSEPVARAELEVLIPPPSTLFLYGRFLPGWEAVRPITITVAKDDDGAYIVTDDVSVVYGIGESPIEAIREYKEAFTEYYRLIEKDACAGNQPAQIHLQRVRQYIQPAQ